MSWWQALILGLVEGITEYLPVSSTGHLLLTQRMLGIPEGAVANAFAICIQAGAIVAVLGLYAPRVRQAVLGVFGKDAEGLRLSINIIVAFVPAAVVGLLFDDAIEAVLFGLWPIVAAWFVGGLVIFAKERFWPSHRLTDRRALPDLTWRGALVVGLFQCIALWPGTSRSLVTILGGLVVGLSLPAAVEFSFLLGVVTLTAATAYKGLQHGREMIAQFGPGPLFVGFVAAWLSAVAAVRWMVGYLTRHGMQIFGYWRVLLALVVAAWLTLA